MRKRVKTAHYKTNDPHNALISERPTMQEATNSTALASSNADGVSQQNMTALQIEEQQAQLVSDTNSANETMQGLHKRV
jgi:hypothetical protein